MNNEPTDWVNLATTPPSSPEHLDRIAIALGDRGIETNREENPVRQCDKDVATWLRVHANDLPLAWEIAQRIVL